MCAGHTKFDDDLGQVDVIKFQKDGGLSDEEWAEYTVILIMKLNVLMFFGPMKRRQNYIYFDQFNLHALFVSILQTVLS